MEFGFPEEYDFHNDPTYLLAVRNRVVLKNIETSEVKTLENVDVVKLSTQEPDFFTPYDMNVFGQWNKYLIDVLRNNRKSTVSQFEYKLFESFAKTGILYTAIPTAKGGDYYFFFIIPPYLALFWDDYYKPDILGTEAMAAINMTPATHSILHWLKDPEKYVEKAILDKNVYGREKIRSEILDILSQVNGLLGNDNMKHAYVGVFAYNLQKEREDLLVENVNFHITKTIYEAMVQQKEATIKPALKVTLKDVRKIAQENVRKLAATEMSFLEPLVVIYVEPIPIADIGFNFTSKYPTKLTAPISTEPISKSLAAAQECVRGHCELTPDSPATGFIDFDMPVGVQITMPGTVDINCTTYDPTKTAALAQEFGVERLPDEGNKELCEKVKKAIELKIQQAGRK